uniref:Uncharacterized protein n=1 Tax=Rhizophora mucronata TaxID=61149 RepID=A0A2P2QZK0_RHIMU
MIIGHLTCITTILALRLDYITKSHIHWNGYELKAQRE